MVEIGAKEKKNIIINLIIMEDTTNIIIMEDMEDIKIIIKNTKIMTIMNIIINPQMKTMKII